MKRQFKRLENWKVLALGSRDSFTLESRVFHQICLVAIACLLFSVPFDLILGLDLMALVMLLIAASVSGAYYCSRMRGWSTAAVLLFNLCCHTMLLVNFFFIQELTAPLFLFTCFLL